MSIQRNAIRSHQHPPRQTQSGKPRSHHAARSGRHPSPTRNPSEDASDQVHNHVNRFSLPQSIGRRQRREAASCTDLRRAKRLPSRRELDRQGTRRGCPTASTPSIDDRPDRSNGETSPGASDQDHPEAVQATSSSKKATAMTPACTGTDCATALVVENPRSPLEGNRLRSNTLFIKVRTSAGTPRARCS